MEVDEQEDSPPASIQQKVSSPVRPKIESPARLVSQRSSPARSPGRRSAVQGKASPGQVLTQPVEEHKEESEDNASEAVAEILRTN